jgi:hypothetical protein
MADYLRFIGQIFSGLDDPGKDFLTEAFNNFPVGTIYINKTNRKVFVRTSSNATADDWVVQQNAEANIWIRATLASPSGDHVVALEPVEGIE